MLPGRSATSGRNDRPQAIRSLGVETTGSPSCSTEETEGEMAMINPETPTGRLLGKTANLLHSVVEAAWTNDIPSPAKWDLHRIGTDAYLAQRDILVLLGLPGVMAEPQADFDIAAVLDEAAQVVANIPEEFQTFVTQRLQERVTSLVERAFALRRAIRLGLDGGSFA